jgi:hypothetical protein
MLMMSLVLHGAVLMLPIPSDLDKPKPPKKQEQVKITQLPRTRSSPKLSPQSSQKPNPQPSPQPSQSTRSNEVTPPEFLPELTTQLSPQLSESIRLNEQTLPESSAKPNPQPSREPSESTRLNEQTLPESSLKPNPQPSPEPSESTRLNEQTLPEFSSKPNPQPSPEPSESTRLNEQTLPEFSSKPNPQPSPEPSESTPPEPKQQSANPLISQANPEQNPTSQPNKDADQVQTAQQKEMTNILQTISVASSKELPPDIKSQLRDGIYKSLGTFKGKTPKQLGDDFSHALSNKGYKVFDAIPLEKDGFYYPVSKGTFTGYIQLVPSSDGTGTAIILLDKLSQ